jgi:RHS repeat-associated protein
MIVGPGSYQVVPGEANSTSNPGATNKIHYVHTDHLGTPRAITRSTDNQVVWTWENAEAFGNNAPNENPAGLGTFTYNLRMPGQQFDRETGTFYNYFRDYDPGIGRYGQSDAAGLAWGLGTYVYANGDPLHFVDADGLRPLRPATNYNTPPQYLSPYGRAPYLPGVRELVRAGERIGVRPEPSMNRDAREQFGNYGNSPQDNKYIPGDYPGINVPWRLPPIPVPPDCTLICPEKYPGMCSANDDKPCYLYCGPMLKAGR